MFNGRYGQGFLLRQRDNEVLQPNILKYTQSNNDSQSNNKMERIINIIIFATFLFVAIGALVAVVIKGAWWHLGTLAICYAMLSAVKADIDASEAEADNELKP